MKCPVCGSQNPDSSDTCSVCGYDLTPYPYVLGEIPEVFLQKEQRRVAAAKRVWEKAQARVAAVEAKQAELEAQLQQLQAQESRTSSGLTGYESILIRSFKSHSDEVWSANFSPDGTQIVSASKDRTVKLWRVSDGQLIRSFKGHSHKVTSVNFSPDGTMVVSASWDKTVKLWLVNT